MELEISLEFSPSFEPTDIQSISIMHFLSIYFLVLYSYQIRSHETIEALRGKTETANHHEMHLVRDPVYMDDQSVIKYLTCLIDGSQN